VIDRVSKLQSTGAHIKEWLKDEISEHIEYALEYGTDPPEITNWRWPY
jgi:xylulose-5-phosphate/fructose-6-phosphate phosphoketolase